jgi:hypothetical protein
MCTEANPDGLPRLVPFAPIRYEMKVLFPLASVPVHLCNKSKRRGLQQYFIEPMWPPGCIKILVT